MNTWLFYLISVPSVQSYETHDSAHQGIKRVWGLLWTRSRSQENNSGMQRSCRRRPLLPSQPPFTLSAVQHGRQSRQAAKATALSVLLLHLRLRCGAGASRARAGRQAGRRCHQGHHPGGQVDGQDPANRVICRPVVWWVPQVWRMGQRGFPRHLAAAVVAAAAAADRVAAAAHSRSMTGTNTETCTNAAAIMLAFNRRAGREDRAPRWAASCCGTERVWGWGVSV